MSDLIDRLIKQAGGANSWPMRRKFAELIMEECAKACEDPACNTYETPIELIKQHFGIE